MQFQLKDYDEDEVGRPLPTLTTVTKLKSKQRQTVGFDELSQLNVAGYPNSNDKLVALYFVLLLLVLKLVKFYQSSGPVVALGYWWNIPR